VGLLSRILGPDPDPAATMPEVEPFATREDDGSIAAKATVPKLDQSTLKVERKGEGRFVVSGTMWVRPRRFRWMTQDFVFEVELPEAAGREVMTSYDDPTLTIRVATKEPV
jgi:hypothetical protein